MKTNNKSFFSGRQFPSANCFNKVYTLSGGLLIKHIICIYILFFSTLTILASSNATQPKRLAWPFEGIFGTFDRQAAQRGAQVYMEVCSACHSLQHVSYRNLSALGFSEQEIKSIAQKQTVRDGPNHAGEMFDRPATPADQFVAPYPNAEAARSANNGALPVDLSLIIKAREYGANYIYSLITGYTTPPKDFQLMSGLYYNPYFDGRQIAMPAPLTANQVEYMDNTPATVEQMARDVVIFLQWAAEPEMEHRKSLGLKVFMFLTIFTIFFYIVKRRIWKNV